MAKTRVYVETTIPSFYHEARTTPDILARRDWTRRWWADFLVTWNCRHLANANRFGHIRRVNTMLGLFVPALVTPLELLGGRDDSGTE